MKYHLDLNALHSKKRMFIEQEIYAKLVLYNFCSRVSNNIKIKEKGGKNPPDIESLIAKEILPIRPNRQNERKVKAKSPVSFNYRYD
ncbi:hypothetical protein [Holdemanella porci]|uniref:hypothetical protein n=1 Tax=Holdemanella porci TaxID=2652276 RepID=UPI003AB90342